MGWGRKERGGYTGRNGIRQTGREGDERLRKTVRETGNESEMKRDNKKGERQGGKLRRGRWEKIKVRQAEKENKSEIENKN